MEVLQRTANRGSISTDTGYNIAYSNKFESDNSEGILRNYDASTGANCIANNSTTNAKKFTVSYWVKLSELLASGQNIPWFAVAGGYATVVKFQDEQFAAYDDNAGWNLKTNAKFRDTSAWYHLVCAVDTTQSTAANRVNLYVNGVLQTSFATESYGTQNNDNQLWRTNTGHLIGAASHFKGGYITEVHCIDGTQYAASDFGEYDEDSGIWKPKEVDVTYGAQGYYMNWSDFGSANSNANNTGVGKDFSGNTNPFVNLGNWSSADIATDTPTNNFCTMNVLKGGINLSGTVYNRLPLMTEGATVVGNNSNNYTFAEATMGVTSGKWYWEMKPTVDANTNVSGAGIATNINKGFYSTDGTGNFFYHMDGNRYVNGAATGYGAAWATNDILGFAYDADNWTLTCYKNNSSQGNLLASQANLSAEIVIPYMYSYGTHTYQWNFGGYHANSLSSAATDANGYGSFEYAPPSGYYALCTKNLAEYG